MKWTRINSDYRALYLGFHLSVEKTRDGGWNWFVHDKNTSRHGEALYLNEAKSAAIDAARKAANRP